MKKEPIKKLKEEFLPGGSMRLEPERRFDQGRCAAVGEQKQVTADIDRAAI